MYFIYIAQLMAPVSEGGISLDTPPPLVMTPTTWDFAGSKPPPSRPPPGKKKKKGKERERDIAICGYFVPVGRLSRADHVPSRPLRATKPARQVATRDAGGKKTFSRLGFRGGGRRPVVSCRDRASWEMDEQSFILYAAPGQFAGVVSAGRGRGGWPVRLRGLAGRGPRQWVGRRLRLGELKDQWGEGGHEPAQAGSFCWFTGLKM